jgi:hypothetical protein
MDYVQLREVPQSKTENTNASSDGCSNDDDNGEHERQVNKRYVLISFRAQYRREFVS